jgi:hypothetical protein
MSEQRTLPAFAVDNVKDFSIPREVHGFPLGQTALTQLLENCPVVITDPTAEADSLPFNDATEGFGLPSDFRLRQVTSAHQRSFDMVSDTVDLQWQDEYGNSYGALSVKGGNFSKPGILEHETAADRYIAYGLQESSIISRVLQASKVLRSRGISTEHVIGICEPAQYPWPTIDGLTDASEFISLPEYKQRVINKHWRELPKPDRTTDKLIELNNIFKDTAYFMSLRATDSAYRVADMITDDAKKETFDYINKNLLADGEERLDPANLADYHRYLRDFFAPAAGHNLARLHTDLIHGFTHAGNMTALGGLVDLDSVKGVGLGLGDQPVTDGDRIGDLIGVLASINSVNRIDSYILDEKTLTFKTNFEALHSFLESYVNETIRLAPLSAEAELFAAERLTLLLPALEASHNLILREFAEELRTASTESLISLNDYLAPEEQQDRMLNALAEAYRDQDLRGELTEALDESISLFAYFITTDHVSEVDEADKSGQPFDVFSAFMDTFDRQLSELHDEMHRTIMPTIFDYALDHLVASADSEPASMHALSAEVRKEIWQHALNDTALLRTATKIISKQYLLERRTQISEAADYIRPEPFLGMEHTYTELNPSLTDGRYWRTTSAAPLEQVVKELAAQQADVEVCNLTVDIGKSTSVPLTDNCQLLEVVTDGETSGYTTSFGHSDVQSIDFDFEVKPSYILLVELDSNGQRHYTLFDNNASFDDEEEKGLAADRFLQLQEQVHSDLRLF